MSMLTLVLLFAALAASLSTMLRFVGPRFGALATVALALTALATFIVA